MLSTTNANPLQGARYWPLTILCAMACWVPTLGFPSEWMLQDTLKSALVAGFVLTAALMFFWQQRARTVTLLWHGLVWLPLGLVVYALASMAWSHTYLAAVESVRWFLFGLLLWLGLNTLTPANMPKLLWSLHTGAVMACAWAALQFWWDLGWFPQGPNPASTFINRNFFAEYVVCTLPFSVLLLVTQRSTSWLPLLSMSIAFNIVAIMMTGTRSALLALWILVLIATFVVYRYRSQLAFGHWRRSMGAAVTLSFLLTIVLFGSIPTGNSKIASENIGQTAMQRGLARTASLAQGSEYSGGSLSVRATMWKATARMLIANPLAGVGAGAWEVQIPLFQRNDTLLETDYYAHNEILQLLSEYGILMGGGFVAFLLAYLLHAAGSTWRLSSGDQAEGPLRALTLSSLLALLVVSNAGFPWHLASTGMLFALGLAILASSDARLGLHPPMFASRLEVHPVVAKTVIVLLLGCMGLAVAITHQAAMAEYKLVHAIQLTNGLRRNPQSADAAGPDRKALLIQSMREGIAIHPHYRKLTAEVAEALAADQDWANATWILESVARSRPHIAAVWAGLATGYANQGMHDQAQGALLQVQRLKPDSNLANNLQVVLLIRAGKQQQAVETLNAFFDQTNYDYAMLQTGYALGYQVRDWPLVIRTLKLVISTWPEQSADTWFRLGKVYAEPELDDAVKALESFRNGLAAVRGDQKETYRNQVPLPFRERM